MAKKSSNNGFVTTNFHIVRGGPLDSLLVTSSHSEAGRRRESDGFVTTFGTSSNNGFVTTPCERGESLSYYFWQM